jgi:predicted NBD/HSP70 family sugar kinase
MPDQPVESPVIPAHGTDHLPEVVVDSYNVELRDEAGFVGDRASKKALRTIIDDWRNKLRDAGDEDPLGNRPSEKISKKQLDRLLAEGPPEAAGLVHSAVEEFAQELAAVARRFLKLKAWQDTEAIVIGGGLRESRIGELATGRAAVLLKADGIDVDLLPIRNHPDEAGLIGCAHLVPAWLLAGHDTILAVDIGGTNIRAGLVELGIAKHADLSAASVRASEIWRHSDDEPKRDEAVERLGRMLKGLISRAKKEELTLAPFLGIGCPGVIKSDGGIERGGQNLPGNWESSRFNLPKQLREMIPTIREHETVVLMHNDAVVQGLSEAPFMRKVKHWGVFTIGTGLGNARFTGRNGEKSDKKKK